MSRQKVKCSECDGTGIRKGWGSSIACSYCHGKGYRYRVICEGIFRRQKGYVHEHAYYMKCTGCGREIVGKQYAGKRCGRQWFEAG